MYTFYKRNKWNCRKETNKTVISIIDMTSRVGLRFYELNAIFLDFVMLSSPLLFSDVLLLHSGQFLTLIMFVAIAIVLVTSFVLYNAEITVELSL